MEESPINGAIAPQREWTRVIVLAPPPAVTAPGVPDASAKSLSPDAGTSAGGTALAMSEALRAEFQKRDWFAVVHHDPYLALADIALREKAQAARAAWGLQRIEGLALVVVDLQSWEESMVRDLCTAVRRWLPAATLWSASDDRIEPIAYETISPKSPNALQRGHRVFDLDALVAALPRGPATANSLPDDSANAAAPSVPQSIEIERGRLSRDEIDMLLHIDLQDDQLSPEAREGQP